MLKQGFQITRNFARDNGCHLEFARNSLVFHEEQFSVPRGAGKQERLDFFLRRLHEELMSASAIKEQLTRKPFEPFRVVLSNGDANEVRHPELTLLLQNGIYVGVPDKQNDLPERAVWCNLLHVAAIEPVSLGPSN
jgi:hypothetical protein